MNKYCRFCGKPINDKALFCPACGKRQAVDASLNNEDRAINQSGNAITNIASKLGISDKYNKGLIIIVVIVGLIVTGFGSYFRYNYHIQQIKLKQAQQEAIEAQYKLDAEKVQESNNKHRELVKIQVSHAIDILMQGEVVLKSLADDINSGRITGHGNGTTNRQITLNIINNETTEFTNLDMNTKKRILELQDLQIQRVNAMYDGLAGDTSRYAEGGNKYDEFYAKLATLKKDYGIE